MNSSTREVQLADKAGVKHGRVAGVGGCLSVLGARMQKDFHEVGGQLNDRVVHGVRNAIIELAESCGATHLVL